MLRVLFGILVGAANASGAGYATEGFRQSPDGTCCRLCSSPMGIRRRRRDPTRLAVDAMTTTAAHVCRSSRMISIAWRRRI